MEIHCEHNVGPVDIPGQQQHICVGPIIIGYRGGWWMQLVSLQ